MDALALLCNLHGDGPETLRRLRAAGCLDLTQVGELPRAQLDRLLGRGSLAAERFRREGRLLEKRLGGDVALTDGVVATGALGGADRQGRATESHELREWIDAGRAERGAEPPSAPEARPSSGASLGEVDANPVEVASDGAAAEGGGLVHPFPPRKRPEAQRVEEPASGSVLGAFLDRWRDAPEAASSKAASSKAAPPEAPPSEAPASQSPSSQVAPPVVEPSAQPVHEPAAEAAPSAIRQLAEWAQQTRASQREATEIRADEPRTAAAPNAAARVQAATPEAASAEVVEPERAPTRREAPAVERAPQPRTSGRASELLDHRVDRGAARAKPEPAFSHAPAAPAQPRPTARTPLGRLPGGERCGPSLEALAFAGLTCLEELAQASARQLAERSGLAYTEVLRLQFLAERYLSRS